jgi:Flp pilus assembly protein TadG
MKPLRKSLTLDSGGAIYVEFLIAFLPLLVLFFCVAQFADLYAARFVVNHAAYRTARAGAVVYPDDPGHYEAVTKDEEVEAAGYAVLAAKRNILGAEIQISHGGVHDRTPVEVRISARVECIFPIANRLMCSTLALEPTRAVEGSARLPAHAAAYDY